MWDGRREHRVASMAGRESAAQDDLELLPEASNEALLRHLQLRHGLGLSCTYLGEEVLVVVNPFKATPEPPMAGFANREPCDARPHPFAVADRAYRRMRQTGRAQTILLNGVSGAGKTTVLRQLLRYWAGLQGGAPGARMLDGFELLDPFVRPPVPYRDLESTFPSPCHEQIAHWSAALV
jgi:myosin heavy subunit